MSIPEYLANFAKSHLSEFEWDMTKDAIKYPIGAAALWILQVGRGRFRTRRAHAFWRPFLSTDLVIGSFPARDFERTGLVGLGDAIALAELQLYLREIGGNPKVAYADRLDGDELKHTMILLGGPDANSVTRRLYNRIASTLRLGNHESGEISIRDTSVQPPHFYGPSPRDHNNAYTDHGLILRAPNPLAPDKEVMIIAGSFGHGTWAAARHVASTEFLKKCRSLKHGPIECLVQTDVELDTPQNIRELLIRNFRPSDLDESRKSRV